jgi:hypothetical protein
MIRNLFSRIGLLAATALLSAAVGLSGCFNPFSPRIAPVLGFSKAAPVPSSASNLLRLFEWCYNNKALAEYRELFTDDYRFVFSPLDSAGLEYKGTPWTREDELISTTHLFVGGSADQPPASAVRLTLDPNFYVFPDPNYVQWDPTGIWHKNIRTQIVINIQTGDGNAIDISGAARFYLVRGDSAVIPEELRLLGFGPDPNRWYIRRLDDETAQGEPGGFAARSAWRTVDGARAVGRVAWTPSTSLSAGRTAMPAAFGDPPLIVSWGYVKAYYRRLAASATLRASPGPPAR